MNNFKFLILSIIVVLLASDFCIAQEGRDSMRSKKKRVQVKVYISPDICYRKTHSDYVGFAASRSQSGDALTYKAKEEIPYLGYDFGFLTEWKLNKMLFLEGGFSFEKLGYQAKLIDTVYGMYYDGNPPVSYKIWNNMSIKYKYYYLSLPISIEYKINNNRQTYFASFGAALDYLIKYSRKYEFANSNTSLWLPPDGMYRQNDPEHFGISYLFKMGVAIPVKNYYSVLIEPHFKFISRFGKKVSNNETTYQMFFNESNDGTTFSSPYSIGISLGINF